MTCTDCGADISSRGRAAYLCVSCAMGRDRERARRYYYAHPDHVISQVAAYRRRHKSQYRAWDRLWHRKRATVKKCATDSCARPVPTLRGQIKFCLPCASFYGTRRAA